LDFVRKPSVAGQFYDADKENLLKTIEECFQDDRGPGSIPKISNKEENLIGVIAPHAGYIFSGSIAAHSFNKIADNGFADTFIILGPNHTGMGSPISSMTKGSWMTPFGNVPIDKNIANKITKEIIVDDNNAHMSEHSIEVQIPFLQYISDEKEFSFVPINMGMQDIKTSKEIGDIIYDSIIDSDKKIMIIASSDFSHMGFNYMTMPPEGIRIDEYTKNQDDKAIEKILKLDSEGLIKTVEDENITMCGYGPVAVLITVAKKLGCKKAELLKYGTSYEVHPGSSCVGYGAISIQK